MPSRCRLVEVRGVWPACPLSGCCPRSNGGRGPRAGIPPGSLFDQLVQVLGHPGERLDAYGSQPEDVIRADELHIANVVFCVIAGLMPGVGMAASEGSAGRQSAAEEPVEEAHTEAERWPREASATAVEVSALLGETREVFAAPDFEAREYRRPVRDRIGGTRIRPPQVNRPPAYCRIFQADDDGQTDVVRQERICQEPPNGSAWPSTRPTSSSTTAVPPGGATADAPSGTNSSKAPGAASSGTSSRTTPEQWVTALRDQVEKLGRACAGLAGPWPSSTRSASRLHPQTEQAAGPRGRLRRLPRTPPRPRLHRASDPPADPRLGLRHRPERLRDHRHQLS